MDITAILGTNFDADDEKEEYNDDNEDDGVDSIPVGGKPGMLTESDSGRGIKPAPSPSSKAMPPSVSLGTSYVVRESVSVFREGSPIDRSTTTALYGTSVSAMIEPPSGGDVDVDGDGSDDESGDSKGSTASTGSKGQIGRAVQQECRDRSRMPSSA
eukprot:TRINITY_DN16098_c0_g1_i1.p1 TRINITY_DN16098_c0_g1~~TRINITY_DN16098_c0_g1_i1.p1  ORF type:complete len:157 (-),score=28.74 TRINITY_DN16098_c0_g1_i1:22-492(-)